MPANKENVATKNKIQTIKNYILSLKDVRSLGTIVFLVLVLLVTWSGVRAVQTNYTLQKQVLEMSRSGDVQKLENQNLKLENKYLETSQYLEVAARQNLGLAAPGETVLLVPKNVAMANTVPEPEAAAKAPLDEASMPFWRRNVQAWLDFFFQGRGNEL